MFLIRFLLVVGLCWVGVVSAANDVAMTARQSQALGIETAPLAAPSAASGSGVPAQVVIPNHQLRVISTPLAGMVENLLVAVNQPVKKGQVLARLQSPALAELQRDFLQAALQSQLAQNTLSRDEKLFKDGIVAESRYLASRSNVTVLAAMANEKRQALQLAGMSADAVRKLQSGQAIGSALEVVSPIEGVVMEQMLAPGQRVEAATPLFKVARLSPLWLEIQVPLAQAGVLQPGTSVGVPSAQASGKVTSIGRSVAEASQTVLVRAEIGEGAANLRPGQFVEAIVGVAVGAKQWSVPNAALVRVENQVYVFTQTASGYLAQPVRLLGQTASAATISGNLRGDERVVVKGAVALKAAWQGLGGGE